MIIHLDSPSELKQVTDYFGIPMNLAEVQIEFPYALELKTINGQPVVNDRDYNFKEFKDLFL